ncbi:MAG: hypothetical protein ACI4VQ_02450, partial [Clostridia bacterium]
MKRKILYIETCEKIEPYKKIDLYRYIKNNKISTDKLIKNNKANLFQLIKNVKENRAIRDIRYNVKILKLRIMAKFNLIQELEDESKIIYIIYTNRGKEEKIIKKVNFLINQNKDKIVVLSKQIIKNNKQASKTGSKIAEIIEYYENNKYLYSNYIQQILNSIIRIKEEIPEEQSIYILIKSTNLQYINQI